jgi:hypothetical protein
VSDIRSRWVTRGLTASGGTPLEPSMFAIEGQLSVAMLGHALGSVLASMGNCINTQCVNLIKRLLVQVQPDPVYSGSVGPS